MGKAIFGSGYQNIAAAHTEAEGLGIRGCCDSWRCRRLTFSRRQRDQSRSGWWWLVQVHQALQMRPHGSSQSGRDVDAVAVADGGNGVERAPLVLVDGDGGRRTQERTPAITTLCSGSCINFDARGLAGMSVK